MITEEAASMYYFATKHMVSEQWDIHRQSIATEHSDTVSCYCTYARFGAELHNTYIQHLMTWTLFSSAKKLALYMSITRHSGT